MKKAIIHSVSLKTRHYIWIKEYMEKNDVTFSRTLQILVDEKLDDKK